MALHLTTQRRQHGEQKQLACRIGKSTRTLRTWKGRAGASGLPGRPAHDDGARRSARQHVERVWKTLLSGHDGWRTVGAQLEREDVHVPTRLVQESLRELKREAVKRLRVRVTVNRVHVETQARDAVWSLDQTQLTADTLAVAVRDALTPGTLSASIGPAATGSDVVRLLKATAQQRGAWPFVLQVDNGPENNNDDVLACMKEVRVIVLWNQPHTPQHNPRNERGHASWKTALDLPSQWRRRDRTHGRGGALRVPEGDTLTRAELLMRLLNVWSKLDARIPRAALSGLTPTELDKIAPRAEDHACRARFYSEVCEELQSIALASEKPRARRKLEREAIWCALQRHGLVTRTRGGRPIPTVKAEEIS